MLILCFHSLQSTRCLTGFQLLYFLRPCLHFLASSLHSLSQDAWNNFHDYCQHISSLLLLLHINSYFQPTAIICLWPFTTFNLFQLIFLTFLVVYLHISLLMVIIHIHKRHWLYFRGYCTNNYIFILELIKLWFVIISVWFNQILCKHNWVCITWLFMSTRLLSYMLEFLIMAELNHWVLTSINYRYTALSLCKFWR